MYDEVFELSALVREFALIGVAIFVFILTLTFLLGKILDFEIE